ncbi:MAG: hypothetical protein Q9159_002427 [Coniocarpon cinnabarinum]
MTSSYPRPDFVRPDLRWKLLDGAWDFLFDDEDVGLSQKWQSKGIPSEVQVKAGKTKGAGAEADSITQKIAANADHLLQNNIFTDTKARRNAKRSIKVPFVFQCPASGIGEGGEHEVLWYERSIQDPRTNEGKTRGRRVLIRFGAVDYECSIWIDGQYVGGHRGGHVPFDVDITDALDNTTKEPSADRRLTLRVFDSAYDLQQPRGKQYWGAKPESIFYTPSSGIWQSVWMETVPSTRLADSSHGLILRSNDIQSGNLHARVAVQGHRTGQPLTAEIESSLAGTVVSKSGKKQIRQKEDFVNIDLSMRTPSDVTFNLPGHPDQAALISDKHAWRDGVALWSPEHPILYDITIRLFDGSNAQIDEVKTTAGMRSISWSHNDGTFRLNDRPIFQTLVLDQGYWPETFMTPPTADANKKDIEISKAMGFNGCRKHQKLEEPSFLYWADKLGYLVWSEMANGYDFEVDYVDRFDQEWMEAVRRDINHPSIVVWTPVNESWGYGDLPNNIEQRNHIRSLYYMTKTLDPTRPINDNCGWEHVTDDLTTFHDYADGPQLEESCRTMDGILANKGPKPVFCAPNDKDPGTKPRAGAPVLCTEFGGVNIAGKKGERDWGYTTASDPKDLLQRVEKLMMGVVKGGHICGWVYTQLADIEQEVNGLYSPDRKPKLDVAGVCAIQERAIKEYTDKHSA